MNEVRVREGATDAPPIVYGFDIGPRVGEFLLVVSYGPQRDRLDVDRERLPSARIVNRIIFDDHRRSVGEDDWGYLDPETRWRRARFQGWVQAEYGFVNEKDAQLFDRVIGSACLPSD